SGHSGNFVVTIDVPDTTPPDAPVITNAYDNVGDSQGDQLFNNGTTDDTTPQLRGHAEANSVVKIYEGNTLLGSTTAHSDGSWSFTPSARSEGRHTFFATATDAAGKTSAHSGNFVLNIDVPHIAPAIIEHVVDDHGSQTGDIKNGGTTDDTQPHLSGSAEAGSTVSIHQYDPYTREEYVLGSVVAKANGDWDYQLTGGQVLQFGGVSRFWVTTLDSAGNKATSADFKVTLVGENQDDTTAPDAPVIVDYYDDVGDSKGHESNGSTTDDTTPTLNGQAEANSIVKVYEGSTLLGSTTAHGDGTWSFTPSARSEGKHTFFATATDAAGNTSTHSGNFVVNVVLPDLDFKETFESHNGIVFCNSAVYHLDYFNVSVINRGSSYYSPGINNHRDHVSRPVSSTAMTLGAGTKIELEMKHPVTDISFKIGDLTTNEVLTVKYFNSHGSLIETQNHTKYEGLLTTASYHTSEGNEIASIQMSLTDSWYPVNFAYVWIDDVTGHATHASTQSLLMPTTHLMALPAEANDVAVHDVTLSTLSETPQHGLVNLNDGNLNTLHLTLNDILSEAHPNLFVQDGKQQLAVTGDQGDVVELKVEDLAHNTWQDTGAVTAGGIQYEVYQHTGSEVELLVQHGLELHQVA
ncbi:Ig-like domain-containing protein, partial [Rahnella woolbedingensis]